MAAASPIPEDRILGLQLWPCLGANPRALSLYPGKAQPSLEHYLGHLAEVSKALGAAEGPAPEGVQGPEGVCKAQVVSARDE